VTVLKDDSTGETVPNIGLLLTDQSDQQDERSHFSELPYEVLEHIASYISNGKDLFEWIEVLSRCFNLGDWS
jgi:hypothetical protein